MSLQIGLLVIVGWLDCYSKRLKNNNTCGGLGMTSHGVEGWVWCGLS